MITRSRNSKKDRQYNGQKEKDRQYTGQKEKDRQYNGQKDKLLEGQTMIYPYYIYIIVDVIYLRAILNKIPYCIKNSIKSRKALKIHTRKYINIHIQQCFTPW
jgi:hypothetical protein